MQLFKCKGFYFFFYYVFNGDVLDWFFTKTYPIMDQGYWKCELWQSDFV